MNTKRWHNETAEPTPDPTPDTPDGGGEGGTEDTPSSDD